MLFLITGGSGFIGASLVRLVLRAGHAVVNLDRLTYAGNRASLEEVEDHPAYRFVHGDVAERETLRGLFGDGAPDVVIHLAAESHVDRSIDGPGAFIHTNVAGTFALLEEARAWHARNPALRMVHVSTDEVFGSLGDEGMFDENSPYQPHSPYSASKAAGDHLARAWHTTYGLPVLVSHCCNNYGPWQHPEKLIPLAILKAIHGEPIPVYGNGKNVRDWLHVEDHATALLTLATHGTPGESYAVSAHHQRHNLELVHDICSILDSLQPRDDQRSYAQQISMVADRPGHDHRYALDSSKLRRQLGWHPQHEPASALRATVAWYLANPSWWRPLVAQHALLRRGKKS